MDPYSAEGELINIHDNFHQGRYQHVVDFDVSSLAPENALSARILQLRARLELGDVKAVLAETKGERDPALQAVGALAEQRAGNSDTAVMKITELAESAGDNATVQIVGGTVLQAAGKSEEALLLVSKHDSNRKTPLPLYASVYGFLILKSISENSRRSRSNRSDSSPAKP